MEAVNNLDINASRTEYINALRQIHKENLDTFENQIIQVTGVEPSDININNIKNINNEIERYIKKGWNPRDIPDVTMVRIDVNDTKMNLYLEKIKEKFVVIKEYPPKTTPNNKVSISIDVRLPNGTIGQIQIYPLESGEASRKIFYQYIPKNEETGIKTQRKKTIRDFIKLAFKDIKKKKTLKFWEVVGEEAKNIKKNTTLDVEGRTHIMDGQDAWHAKKDHIDPMIEKSRGQIPLEDEDFELIPEILKHPDKIEKSKTDEGLDAIVYSKKVDGTIIYIEEVRSGKYYLALRTMYKKIY